MNLNLDSTFRHFGNYIIYIYYDFALLAILISSKRVHGVFNEQRRENYGRKTVA